MSKLLGTLAMSFVVALAPSLVSPALGAEIPKELQGIGITEHLGESVSIKDLKFKNEDGVDVRLSDYFTSHRPVVLTLVYYECPGLCNFVLNGLIKSLKRIDWEPGKQFDLVTVSIDPTEGPKLAQKKKTSYIESYGKPQAAAGWHFLTGSDENIKKLASQIGFGYRYVESEKQYAHGAAIYVLTPEGKISRYLYGIDFPERDFKLSLVEASDGKVGSVVDRFLLFCYHYDPKTKRYSMVAMNLVKAGSAGTVFVFGGYLAVFWNRQRRLVRREPPRHTKSG